jgi:hypothetical protein
MNYIENYDMIELGNLSYKFKISYFISSFLYICFIYDFVELGESLKIYIDCLWYW